MEKAQRELLRVFKKPGSVNMAGSRVSALSCVQH